MDDSQQARLAAVAADLPQPFTAADLVVAAWKRQPATFSLPGYPHPDSNKVLALLFGKRGLVARGHLVRCAAKTYRVASGSVTRPRKVPTLTAAESAAVSLATAAAESPAGEKYRRGGGGEIRFAEACETWGLDLKMAPSAVDNRLAAWRAGVRDAARLFRSRDVISADGRVFGLADATFLDGLAVHLDTRFDVHLRILRAKAAASGGQP